MDECEKLINQAAMAIEALSQAIYVASRRGELATARERVRAAIAELKPIVGDANKRSLEGD